MSLSLRPEMQIQFACARAAKISFGMATMSGKREVREGEHLY